VSAGAEPSLAVRRLRKTFGHVVAVDDVSLEAAPGEFLSLLGPSGCGKSTVLRMVAGLLEPDRGEVVLAGEDITRVAVHRRNLGLVFQSYALFPHMTVFDNVAFGLRRRRVAEALLRPRVERMLDLVRLGPLGARYPRELSGGQQQRVALARALVTEPRVLLLDEPLSNLDALLRDEMRVELKRLQQRLGTTMIFVTHDQAEALILSDRVLVMEAGGWSRSGDRRTCIAGRRRPSSRGFSGARTSWRASSRSAGRTGSWSRSTADCPWWRELATTWRPGSACRSRSARRASVSCRPEAMPPASTAFRSPWRFTPLRARRTTMWCSWWTDASSKWPRPVPTRRSSAAPPPSSSGRRRT
jgi:ABC-type Fe3+/spermidine/putrescine transport system ATPase subunit